MTTVQERVDLMVRLGSYLTADEAPFREVKEKAYRSNPWFIPRFINLAIKNICAEFLNKDRLEAWVSSYPLPGGRDQQLFTVGIVMAGNIPLVGFHDFLCGFISGYPLRLKLSGKDETLLKHIIEKLSEWDPGIKEIITLSPLLKNCDAYIATGSNNSARYFDYYFAKYPRIIRRNRTSVAVLEGNESSGELKKLAADTFLYFGLGCRNITKIYTPPGYDFLPLLQAFREYDFVMDHHKYKNNFDYNLALHLLNNTFFMSSDNLIMSENPAVFSPVSVLYYEGYEDKGILTAGLVHNEDIQCIVGHGFLPFGSAQQPGLTDYADGVDTMKFLSALQ